MYLNTMSKQQKHKNKQAKRKERNPFAFDLEHLSQFSECTRDYDSNNHDSSRFKSTHFSNANRLDDTREGNRHDVSFGSKFLNKTKKLLNKKDKYSKIEAKQILKVVSALLLILSANEALAWDLEAGAKAMLKPWYNLAVNWWKYFVGLAGCALLIFSEGDLRVKSKTAAMGAALAAGVILGLIAAMGVAIT